MAEQVTDGIWRVSGSRCNFYVIVDGDALTLIDSGYPGDWPKLVQALEHLGRSPADVTAVVLTHAHPDHLGSAERLRARHDAGVHVHEDEAPMARGERKQQITIGYMVSRLWWPKMITFVLNAAGKGGARPTPVGEPITFRGPAPLDVPGRPIPIHTPGHTDGHCAFHLPDRGVLFTGDGLVTHDSLTQETGPRLLGRAFNHDQAEAARSLAILRDIQADLLLPGHGEPLRGSPAAAVDQALARL